MAAVNELVTKFTFIGNLQPMDDFNKNLNRSIKGLARFSAFVAGAGTGFAAWATNVTQGLDPLIQLSRETDVAIDKIQQLGFAASVTGSSEAALQNTIQSLSKSIGESARGMGQANQAFSRLGVQVRNTDGSLKGADQVLNEVRQSVQRLNIPLAEQQSILSQMGIDKSLIQMLNTSNVEMNNLIQTSKNLGNITQQQADDALRYNDSMTTLKRGLRSVQQQMAVGLAPTLTQIANGFTDLLINNRGFIQNGLVATGEALIDISAAFVRLLPVFAVMGAAFIAVKIATLGFAGAMAILFAPVVLITGAIVLTLLAIDDLIVAFKGGESVIKDFFQAFTGVDVTILPRLLVEAFKGAFDDIKPIIEPVLNFLKDNLSGITKIFVGDFSGGAKAIAGAFTDLGKEILDKMKATGDAIAGIFKEVGARIKEALVTATINLLPSWALKLLGLSINAPDSGALVQPQNVPVPTAQANFLRQDAVRMGMGGTTNNNSNINQDVEIVIQTNNAERAGTAVQDSLQRQLETAQTQSRRGGR